MVVSGSEQHPADTFDQVIVDSFRDSLRGRLVLPGDPGYNDARVIWNSMIDKRPALIVQPVGVADVISSVNFAREHELLLAIKGGGHNVAGNAVCDDGLMIDLSSMTNVVVDPLAQTAYVGGGALWQDVDHETSAFDLVTTGGIVSTTGVAVLTLGGGVGWLNAKFGMSCDNVLAFDLVLADGSFVRASAEQHPDLYWALKGGGGNFGVVTGFLFQLHPFDGMVTAGAMMYSADRTSEIAYFYRDFLNEVSSNLVADLSILTDPDSGQRMVAIAVCHAGSEEVALHELAGIKSIPSPLVDMIDSMSYVSLQQAFNDFFPHGLKRYWKSQMFSELTDEVLDLFVKWSARLPTIQSALGIEHYHGKYSEPSKHDTAYWHRDAPYQIVFVAQWTNPNDEARCIKWVRDFYDALTPYSTNAPYLNFNIFDEAELVDRVQASFGGNYERLVQVKNKYDPTNFFRVNNNIKPTV